MRVSTSLSVASMSSMRVPSGRWRLYGRRRVPASAMFIVTGVESPSMCTATWSATAQAR